MNNETDSRIPLQFTDNAITRYRLESTNKLHIEKHVLENSKMTLRESYTVPSDRRYEPEYFLASERYYIELTDTMDIYDIQNKKGIVNSLTKDQLTASNNFIIEERTSYTGKKLHNNIALYKGHSELYYLNILSKEQHPLSLIRNVHSFDTENQNLLVAYENTIRLYQIKDDRYSEVFNYSSNECTGSTPIGVSLNNNKAIILKQWSSREILQYRNFLCIYDISGGNAKFETKLEIPSAATGPSKFTIKDKDLYGVIGNDGRLFHYQQNFAPTFATNVTVQEDSNSSSLLALSDAENDTLTLQITKPAAQGNASIVGNQISYAPKTNYHGNDAIGVKVTDAVGNVTEQEVNITITSVNDLPIIEALQFTLSQNEKYSGQLKATDVDGDKLSFTALTQPKLGLLTLNNDGSFSYQSSQSGDDSFEVKVGDSNGGESKTLVIVKVSASTSTGGSTSEPTKTESAGGGSTGFFSLILLSVLAWRRRYVN